jgi:Cu/Ag efflux protein CusF
MRTKLCSFCLVSAIGLVTLTAPLATAAAETIQRSMQGTVMATNTAVDPQTIVVKVTLPNQEELIVGARVPTDTKTTRGNQATKLADLKVGETAEITYLKSPDGLIAQSIHVR